MSIGNGIAVSLTDKQKREACAVFHKDGVCSGHTGGTHSLGPLFGKLSKHSARNEQKNR